MKWVVLLLCFLLGFALQWEVRHLENKDTKFTEKAKQEHYATVEYPMTVDRAGEERRQDELMKAHEVEFHAELAKQKRKWRDSGFAKWPTK